MSIGTELEKLKQLQESGVLTEAEFLTAKAKLLSTLGPENTVGAGVNHFGNAAKSWVNLQWVTSAVGLITAVLMVVFVFIPFWQDMRKSEKEFDEHFKATQQRIEQSHQDMDVRRNKFDEDFEKQSREMDAFRKKNFGN
jgi:cytochrome c-type biogenesis protein CcmH/NrfG